MLFDAHAHIGTEKEIRIRAEEKIHTFLCGTNPLEWQKVLDICKKSPYLIPTLGIHPWYSEQYPACLNELEALLPDCTLLGEIGLDATWCEVPPKVQMAAFVRQLEIGRDRAMPVILHTKGQEGEVLKQIKKYPNSYIVHWYSCDDYIEEYIDLDCFFTIGPDIGHNHQVQQVAKMVPLNRLLIETDGIAAVGWALNTTVAETKLSEILMASVTAISRLRGLPAAKLLPRLAENFYTLTGKGICGNGFL